MPECESLPNKDTSAWPANSHAISFNKSASQSFLVFHTHFVNSLMVLLELHMFINIYNMYNAWLSLGFPMFWLPLIPISPPIQTSHSQKTHRAVCSHGLLPWIFFTKISTDPLAWPFQIGYLPTCLYFHMEPNLLPLEFSMFVLAFWQHIYNNSYNNNQFVTSRWIINPQRPNGIQINILLPHALVFTL